MTEQAQLDELTGGLLLSAEAWEAISSAPEPLSASDDVRSALANVGAIDGEQLEPTLARCLRAVRDPGAVLLLERRGSEVRGWADAEVALLLVPRHGSLLEVAPSTLRFLPDLLARLVELEPRPAPSREPDRFAPGALAEAIAGGAALGGLSPMRDHWMLEVTRPAERTTSERVEVLDTEDGLWELERDSGSVRSIPTTATGVWRRLTELAGTLTR